MSLPSTLNDREYQKFADVSTGITAVRVTGENFSGTFTLSGLNVAGRVTSVALNSSTWTALPATALANRNAMAVQNQSAINMYLNYDPAAVGFLGMLLIPGETSFKDISANVTLYGKSASGTPSIIVEEVS